MRAPAVNGFTLIEVMVALLVVAIAYTGVAAAVSGFADQRLMLVERHTGHRVAWNRLMEQYLVSRGVALAEPGFAASSGEVFVRDGRWRWEVTEEHAAGKGLSRYQVDVYGEGKSPRGVPAASLTAFFTRPAGAVVP